ncbi:MAG TPA: potassium-transporting ATPase subunit C [Tepidisphaeraceae bacterium]|nr:potassium-transporting ATPase subunit C [Tepidisphaeraceae bacterium]
MTRNHNTTSESPEPKSSSPGFGVELFNHIKTSIIATLVLGLIVSGVYPLIVWSIAQVVFTNKANGSLLNKDGQPAAKDADAVGSALIGQNFSAIQYFHPRPSAAGNGYDATASGGSNLGPTSAKLMFGTTKKDDKGAEVVDYDGIADRVIRYCEENAIEYSASIPKSEFHDAGGINDVKLITAFNASATPPIIQPATAIPADAVTASASGLDPHISPANATLQAARVSDARKVPVEKVKALIAQCTDAPSLGILGDAGVNVLRLNLALDKAMPMAVATAAPAPATQP